MTASKVKFEGKVAKVGKANWSQLENARRIAASMLRYGYVDSEAEAERLFMRLVKMIERDIDTWSRAQLRGFTNALGLNSDTKTRNKTAKLVLKLTAKA